jgi:hypothetical protein
MGKAARSTFLAGPDDELAAVDVYTEVTPETRNAFQSSYSAFSEGLTSRLGATRTSLSDLASGVRNKEIGLNTARKRLQESIGGSIRELNDLPDNLRSRFIEQSGVGSPEHNYMVGKINDLEYVIKNGDYRSAEGIMGVLGGLTGNPVFDAIGLGPVIGVIQVGLEELAKWEVPELLDELMDYLGGSPQDVKDQVVRGAATRLAGTADLEGLKVLLKHVNGSVLLSTNPQFVQQFLQRFSIPDGKDASHYPELRQDLISVMTQIKSDWLYLERRGESAFNFQVLALCSEDAQLVLCTDPELVGGVIAAPHYRLHDHRQLARQMYPLIAL